MAVHVDRSLGLPASEYFAMRQLKSGIALHHTVCDSAERTLALWERDRRTDGKPRRIGTAYVIDRDGTIYEAFDPACWAWQFGLSWRDAERIAFEKRFVGIEITSEGRLLEHEGRLYASDRVSPLLEKPAGEALDCGTPYRGYRWFDRYEPEQLDALGRLVDDLCTRFSIPRVYPAQPYLYYGEALRSFAGVIDHANAQSWRAQKDQLLAVDSLRLAAIALQDSITRLVAANAEAYQSGYQAAYAAYQDLSQRHIAELKTPRIRLGSALGFVGAAGIGVVVGRVMP